MPIAPRIIISITLEQAEYIAEETGVEINKPADLKKALRVVFPNMPEDKKAGAPAKKPYQRKKKTAKGE
jgi:hypothetical protein